MKTRWDVPLLNERSQTNSLISTELVRDTLIRIVNQRLAWHRMFQIAELRRSCGVKSEPQYVQVNLPARYRREIE